LRPYSKATRVLVSITFLAALLTGGVTAVASADGSLEEGAAYGWGRNAFGSLGDGTATNRTEPTQARMPSGVTFSSTTTSYWTVCSIGSDGNTYCWGYNGAGQLGDGTYTSRTSPKRPSFPLGVTLTDVATGFNHTCAISSTGEGYCWGQRADGQVGNGGTSGYQLSPIKVTMPTDVTFTSLAAGFNHTCALGTDGNAYCWGGNDYGQLGVGDTTDRAIPTLVTMPSSVNFTAIAAGHDHACALGSDEVTYCWGGNDYGQLGTADTVARLVPTEVSAPSGVNFASIASGYNVTCALTDSGGAYCWGLNNNGQLGVQNTSNKNLPTSVMMPAGVTFTSIDPGYEHTCAVSSDLDAYCWGSNQYRELGDGTVTRRTTPTLVIAPTGVSFAAIAPGRDFTIALTGPPSASPPDAPTDLEATPVDGAAEVSFTAGSNGGSAITNYKYELDGGESWTALNPLDSSSPVTIPNLTNGTEYSIRLRAVNEMGDGAISDSVTVTPIGTPDAPTVLSATAQDQGASISFTAGSDGGSPIEDYEYQLDGGDWKSADTTSSPVVINGLTNGTTYSVKIRGVNGVGNGKGTASSAVNVIPVSSSDPPGVPTAVELVPGDATLSVSWEEPSQGGAPITDYEYSTDNTTWISFSSTNTSATLSSNSSGDPLVNGEPYTVRIRATNTNGPGPGSMGTSQTPGIPLAPSVATSAWDETDLNLQWTPGNDNGDPVAEYQIVVSQLSQRSGFRMLRSGPGTYTTTSTSFTVTGLNPVPTYTITLSARNGRGWGLPTSFTVAGTGQVEEDSQTPPSIIQQVGLPPTGTCEDVIDGMFGTQTFIPGGWGQSWARWMNNGLGGAVCTRMLVYSNAQGRWILQE